MLVLRAGGCQEQAKPLKQAIVLVLRVGGCQRERVETPKTSGRARSRGWWLSEKG